jgi:hypothetical protein
MATDPEFRDRNNAQQRLRRAKKPARYRELRNARDRHRYATEPKFREQILAKARQRYITDPEFRVRVLTREKRRYATETIEARERRMTLMHINY